MFLPQMSPMWWMTMMLMFMMLTSMMMNMIYFNYNKSISMKKIKEFKKMNWKW